MQRRPTVGPGSQKAPFRERLPRAISKLGKGTALHSWQTCGGVGGVGDGIAKVAVMGSVWGCEGDGETHRFFFCFIRFHFFHFCGFFKTTVPIAARKLFSEHETQKCKFRQSGSRLSVEPSLHSTACRCLICMLLTGICVLVILGQDCDFHAI